MTEYVTAISSPVHEDPELQVMHKMPLAEPADREDRPMKMPTPWAAMQAAAAELPDVEEPGEYQVWTASHPGYCPCNEPERDREAGQ